MTKKYTILLASWHFFSLAGVKLPSYMGRLEITGNFFTLTNSRFIYAIIIQLWYNKNNIYLLSGIILSVIFLGLSMTLDIKIPFCKNILLDLQLNLKECVAIMTIFPFTLLVRNGVCGCDFNHFRDAWRISF